MIKDTLSTIMLHTDWEEITTPFYDLFYDLFGGNLPVVGLVAVLFFLMFILSLRFSASLMVIIMIPVLFWINSWTDLADMLVIAGILFGGILGAALLKWYHKR